MIFREMNRDERKFVSRNIKMGLSGKLGRLGNMRKFFDV
jgi:hypothetical protein